MTCGFGGQDQPPAPEKFESYDYISWSKFGVSEHLKLQNHSNNCELSKNAGK